MDGGQYAESADQMIKIIVFACETMRTFQKKKYWKLEGAITFFSERNSFVKIKKGVEPGKQSQ